MAKALTESVKHSNHCNNACTLAILNNFAYLL
jgi:hypothetical protein